MRKKRGGKHQSKQLRLPTPPPQLDLLLPDEVPEATADAVHWRMCRECGRPIHPDAPRCGWCPKPLRRTRPAEESGSLF
jgi:hypothetical protein